MKYLKPLIIIAILGFTGLFLYATDWEKVVLSLQRVGYYFILLLLISFTSYFLGTVAWRYCMGSDGKRIPLAELFIIRHIGETVGIVNPTSIVAGEAVKVYLLRNHNIEKKTVITSVLLSRMVMMLTQVIVFIPTALYVLFNTDSLVPDFNNVSKALFIVLLTGLCITGVIKLRRQIKMLLKAWFGIYATRRTIKLRNTIHEALFELSLFFKTNKKALAFSVIFFLLHWIIGSLEFFVILKLLEVTVSFIPVIFADMSVILFKSAGAFVPAQIGIEEYGNKVMLATIGITALEVWVTASILRRARQLFWIAFGLGAYFFIGRKKESLLPQTDVESSLSSIK